jgi:hypothetical protein
MKVCFMANTTATAAAMENCWSRKKVFNIYFFLRGMKIICFIK